jgi:hypothetical protein
VESKTPKEHAENLQQLGVLAFKALEDAIAAERPPDSLQLQIHAERIRLCNAAENHWVANDLHTNDGELYNAYGKFWSCHSKLCPGCLAKETRRARKRFRNAVERHRLMVGQWRQLLTLTIPNLGLDLLTTRKIAYHAWTLFRKRKWFKDTILGGCRSEEFTITPTGFHYHMHLLCITKYIHWATYRAQWTDCVLEAFDFVIRQRPPIHTVDGLVIANATKIGSLDGAMKEVAKYLTKADGWAKLDKSSLLDVARIPRFPRMFEQFGCLSNRALSPADAGALDDAAEKNKAILDKECISDGTTSEKWRNITDEARAAEYLHDLYQRFGEIREFRQRQLKRKYHAAQFWRLKPTHNVTANDAEQRIVRHASELAIREYLNSTVRC